MNHSLPSFPLSRSFGVAALMGALGFALVLLGELGSVWLETGQGVMRVMAEAGFLMGERPVHEGLSDLWPVLPLGFLTALVMVETPGLMRRMMLLFSVLILITMWCPVAGLWGRFFNPLPTVIGVFVSGVGVMIYMEAARARYAQVRFEELKARQQAIESEKVVEIGRKEEPAESGKAKRRQGGKRGKSTKA